MSDKIKTKKINKRVTATTSGRSLNGGRVDQGDGRRDSWRKISYRRLRWAECNKKLC